MVIRVTGRAVTLEEPEDCRGFKVVADDIETLAGALAEHGAGRMDGEHAFIDMAWVEEQAQGRVGPGWAEELTAMKRYAATKGWLSEDGSQIQAHIEEEGTG